MMLPSLFSSKRYNPFRDFPTAMDLVGGFDTPIFPTFGESIYGTDEMRTDIKETDTGYEVAVDLPGFDKDGIKLTLNDGYLRIDASKAEKENDDEQYIRRERYSSVSRAFYVGTELVEEDIKAKFENGVLKLNIPKKNSEDVIPEKKYIAIEG